MEENLMVNERMIKCMDMVNSSDQMERFIKETMSLIERKAMENSFGLMAKYIKAIGRRGNNMGMEKLLALMEK